MYDYMYIYMYVCVHVYKHTNLHVNTRTYTRTNTHTYVCTRTLIHILTHVFFFAYSRCNPQVEYTITGDFSSSVLSACGALTYTIPVVEIDPNDKITTPSQNITVQACTAGSEMVFEKTAFWSTENGLTLTLASTVLGSSYCSSAETALENFETAVAQECVDPPPAGLSDKKVCFTLTHMCPAPPDCDTAAKRLSDECVAHCAGENAEREECGGAGVTEPEPECVDNVLVVVESFSVLTAGCVTLNLTGADKHALQDELTTTFNNYSNAGFSSLRGVESVLITTYTQGSLEVAVRSTDDVWLSSNLNSAVRLLVTGVYNFALGNIAGGSAVLEALKVCSAAGGVTTSAGGVTTSAGGVTTAAGSSSAGSSGTPTVRSTGCQFMTATVAQSNPYPCALNLVCLWVYLFVCGSVGLRVSCVCIALCWCVSCCVSVFVSLSLRV